MNRWETVALIEAMPWVIGLIVFTLAMGGAWLLLREAETEVADVR